MDPILPKFGLLFFPLVLWGIVIVLQLIALIDIVKREFGGSEKTNWLLIVLLTPIIGPILYFIMGKKPGVY